jgi:uncharacterized protein
MPEKISRSNAAPDILGNIFPSAAHRCIAGLYAPRQKRSFRPMDDLRSRFPAEMKAAMKAGDAARTSALRMIMAKLKEVDIAARPLGVDKVADEQVVSMLRGMVKSRRESAELYRQGNRPELAAKEEAEIAVIEGFLPQQMDEAAMASAIREAVAETGAASVRDMGKVMAALRARHAATLDMAKAGPMVKAALAG